MKDDDDLDEIEEEEEEDSTPQLSIHQDNSVAVLMEQENRRHRQTLADLFRVGKQKGLLTGITKYGG